MSGATRRQDVMIRISGIFEFIDPNHLGFQESEVTLPQGEVGFQESGQEAGAAGTDCRNLHFHGPCCSPFFWNPAPLMQNYMIKSVKMTKKSIFRDQFSWKVRTFAQNLCENGLHLGKERALCTRFAPSLSHAFSQRHHFILLNFSDEPRPLTRFYEQNQISIGAAHHSADSTIADLGPSRACRRIWDGVCVFFMPIPIVLPPTET